jgi:hypothetical protein
MTKDETRRFEELCAKLITEKDESKFAAAVRELNAICDKKESRLREQPMPAGPRPPLTISSNPADPPST